MRWTTPRTSPRSRARDLLFARLLQYRAYKQVAELFGELEAAALQRYPRSVSLEERFTGLLPEVTLGVDAARFAEIAAAGLARARHRPSVARTCTCPRYRCLAQARLVMAMLPTIRAPGSVSGRSSPPAITRTR